MKNWKKNSWRKYPVKHIPEYPNKKELDNVLDKIGKPLFVDSGLDSRIVWVYEVRTITVQSKGSKKGQENKTNGKVKHNNSILHEMALVFENGKVLGWGDYATYDSNHQYGFYSNCNEVTGCQGDLDDCGNCQPPVVVEEDDEEDEDKTLTPKCCGENLYLIDDDGNVILPTGPGLGMELNWDYINDNLIPNI